MTQKDLLRTVSKKKSSSNYFNREDIWGEQPEIYQTQIRETLKALLHSKIETVLDAGCGNGMIVNYLPKKLDVTGIDLSSTALQNVKARKCQGNITALPFPDQSFDFIYCFDVIEHLEESDIVNALREMQRVAKKHVLISVPFNEDLQAYSSQCTNCRHISHINGHLRSYSIESLLNLFLDNQFERSAIFLSGDSTATLPETKLSCLYPRMEFNQHHADYTCPQCGAIKQAKVDNSTLALQYIECFRSQLLGRKLSQGASWCNRSEVMVLLTRKGYPCYLPTQNTHIKQTSLLDVDFSNFQQKIAQDFVPGALWSRFLPGCGTKVDQYGISLSDPTKPQSTPIMIRLPVNIQVGDKLTIEASGSDQSSLSLFGIEGLTGQVIPLLEQVQVRSNNQKLTVNIVDEWLPDRFGSALDLYIYGNIFVHRIIYQPVQTKLIAQPFAVINPGLSVVNVGKKQNVPVFWTYYANSQGIIPISFTEKDTFLLEKKNTQEESNTEMPSDTIKLTPLAYLRNFLRAIKIKLFRPVVRIFLANGKLNVDAALYYPVRWQPVAAEDIPYAKDRPGVIVLSHLFPHPDQPGLGSFVLEHLKSLQKEGIDVRVVSGRPFWLGARKNPFRLLGEFFNYCRFYKACSKRWWVVEGIPVRYLPYPILGPFWTHGWSYHTAIARNRKKIKQEFNFNLIHAHTGYLDGGAARLLAARSRCPYIVTEHTGPFSMLMDHFIIRNITLKALRNSAYVTAVSRSQRNNILSYLGVKYQEKLHVIPNVVNFDLFPFAINWKPNPMAPKILFVGYFVPIKNISLLLKAFQYVHSQRPLATLTLVGGAETLEQELKLKQEIQELAIQTAVKIKGYVEQSEVSNLMSNECDILVLTSKSESFGCVVAEALATGRPAVITRCGGPEDIVIDDSMGEICENNDPEAFAKAILSVADRLSLMDPKKIRRSAQDRFSSDIITKKYINLYDQII